jgi:nucleoside-diphosphate-sugar epimerase
MNRVLVTGASGFLGRAVVAAFAQDGYPVRAAVRAEPLRPFADGVELIKHPDLTEPIDWRPLLDGIDVVIHLAGIAYITTGVTPDAYDRVNRLATEQAAIAAARCGVRRFVFVSSIRAQSGPAADHVLTERDPPSPTDDYGRSKLAAEKAVACSGVPFTVLRPVLLYGPSVKGNFAALIRAANSPWPLPVGLFANRRSILGIGNFVSALHFVLSAPATAGETYVVADPAIPPSLAELIAMMRQAQGRRPQLLPVPTEFVEFPLRLLGRGDLWQRIGGNLRVDPGKLMAAGWTPRESTQSGVAAMVRAG